MGVSLYNITENLLTVINGGMVIDSASGEIIFDAENLEELECEYADKLEACGIWCKNEIAEAEAIREEEKRLADRRRAKEQRVERLKEYMLRSMESTDTSKIETAKVAISTRKSQRLVVDDERAIPLQFIRVKQEINKQDLKKALKNGDVEGAHIEDVTNLQLK